MAYREDMSLPRLCWDSITRQGRDRPRRQRLNRRLARSGDGHMQVLVSLSCTMCPELVTAAQRIAAEHPEISAEVYDLSQFPALQQRYKVMSVPCLVVRHAGLFWKEKHSAAFGTSLFSVGKPCSLSAAWLFSDYTDEKTIANDRKREYTLHILQSVAVSRQEMRMAAI